MARHSPEQIRGLLLEQAAKTAHIETLTLCFDSYRIIVQADREELIARLATLLLGLPGSRWPGNPGSGSDDRDRPGGEALGFEPALDDSRGRCEEWFSGKRRYPGYVSMWC